MCSLSHGNVHLGSGVKQIIFCGQTNSFLWLNKFFFGVKQILSLSNILKNIRFSLIFDPRVPGPALGSSARHLAFGFWLLASGSWLLAFGFWLLASGFWLLAFGFWLLALGFWLLAFGFCLLAVGFWLLAFGFWPLAFDF